MLEVEKGVRIKALKNVTINEPFFVGHFPAPAGDAGRADARGAGAGRGAAVVRVAWARSPATTRWYYFVGIDGARFKRPVEPGDQLMLEVELDRVKSRHLQVQGARHASTARLAVEAELMCTMRNVA